MKHVFTFLAFVLVSSGFAQESDLPPNPNSSQTAAGVFGGDDHIWLTDSEFLNFGQSSFTAHVQFRSTDLSNLNECCGYQTLIAKGASGGSGNKGFNLDLRGEPDNARINCNFISSAGNNLNLVAPIEEGVWYDLVYVVDWSNELATLYVNGTVVDEGSIAGLGSMDNDWYAAIGRYVWDNNDGNDAHFFRGEMSWLRMIEGADYELGPDPCLEREQPLFELHEFTAEEVAAQVNSVFSLDEVVSIESQCETTVHVFGCMEPAACNYDEGAEEDDGSCTYPTDGQTCDDFCVLALPDTIVQCFNSSTLIEAGVQRGTFFDGVDDWILTSESGVTGMSPMSVSFWALTDHNGAMDIFTQATDDDSWADIRFGMNTPQCGLVGPSFKSPAHFATFPYPVDNQNWHHYAYVLGDGSMSFSNLKIYVDGELHSASTGEEFCGHNWGGWTYDAADVPIRLGVGLPLGGFYSGYLDDMALWSKALSQDEVFEIMANDALAVSEDLVSFWPLDQLEDGFFLDMVGNNHGAPVGGVGTETPLPQGVVTWFSGSQMPNLVVTPNQTTAYGIQSVLESGQVCADTTVVEVIDFEYADLNDNGICDQLEGEGCMDPVACNYSEFALVDDGSCDFSCCPGPGCCSSPNVWDPATQMCVNTAASCGEGTVWDESLQQCLPEDMCFADLDNDGVVGMDDLLDLLTRFGLECAD